MPSQFALLLYDQLEEDPKNIRTVYSGIDELARTIYEFGLLQNLVVIPLGNGKFVVRDGNRRKKAIGHLIKTDHWPKEKGIPCLILDSDGNFEQLVAEVQKQEAPIWHLGFRFNEFEDSGCNQEQISSYIGRSRGFVSRCQHIAANLCPEAIARLDALPPKALTAEQVHRVSVLVHPVTKKPDKEAQLGKIQSFLDLPRAIQKAGKHKSKDRNNIITKRLYKLKTAVRIPAHAAKVVNAVIDYLDGTTNRLKV